jgi:hypothetical protein
MEAKTEARVQELMKKIMEQQTNEYGIKANGQTLNVTRIYYRKTRRGRRS